MRGFIDAQVWCSTIAFACSLIVITLPAVASAQDTLSWRMQVASSTDKVPELAQSFVNTLDKRTQDRLRLTLLTPGSAAGVPEAAIPGAITTGQLDAAWVLPANQFGLKSAFTLLQGTPYGLRPRQHAEWVSTGDGADLLDALFKRMGFKGIICGISGPGPGLWSNRLITLPDDLKGLVVGGDSETVHLLNTSGATTEVMSSSDAVERLQTGELDAASMHGLQSVPGEEQSAPATYYYTPGQPPSSIFVLLLNRKRWDGLGLELRKAIDRTCADTVRHALEDEKDKRRAWLKRLRQHGVVVRPWPLSVEAAMRSAWVKKLETIANNDEIFAYVLKAMQATRDQVTPAVAEATTAPLPSPQVISTLVDQVPIHDCDRLAAHPLDSDRIGPGLKWDELNPQRAITACESALATYPDTARFHYQLARALEKAKRYAEAVIRYEAAVQRGYAKAQARLGFFYFNGMHGLPKEVDTAIKLFRKSVKQGSPHGQKRLAYAYHHGIGVEKDFKESARLYRLAVDQGDPFAMMKLALFYFEGKGVGKDEDEAMRLLHKAAALEQHHANALIGWRYNQKKQYAKAAEWYLKGAKLGNVSSQWQLGIFYRDGRGLTKNRVKAYMWFLIAKQSRAKLELGKTILTAAEEEVMVQLEAKMHRKEIAKAKRRAQEWQERWRRTSRDK